MEKVIYINTFSKSLAPAFRISYLVLPRHLVTRFYETLGFYSGTVSCLEQMTLARFLAQGYFEKHINRLRIHYHASGICCCSASKAVLFSIMSPSKVRTPGLHFLMKIDTELTDEIICSGQQTKASALCRYPNITITRRKPMQHILVVNSLLPDTGTDDRGHPGFQ